MGGLIRPSIVAGFAALLFLCPASAQTGASLFDPDPAVPDAQQTAEFLAIGAVIGMTPPPVGWNCTLETVWYGPMPMVEAQCEPDPALLGQQEQQRQQWLDRLERNSQRSRSRLGRRR